MRCSERGTGGLNLSTDDLKGELAYGALPRANSLATSFGSFLNGMVREAINAAKDENKRELEDVLVGFA